MIKKIVNIIFVAAVFFVANSLSSAQAQIYQTPVNVNSGIMTQRIMTQNNINAAMISGMIRSNMMKNSSGKGSAKRAAANRTPADPLGFSPAAANSVIKPLALQMSEKGNTQALKEAEQIFQQALKIYGDRAKEDKFPSNDIAYAFEYFLVNNFHIHHDVLAGTANVAYYDISQIPNFVNWKQEQTLYQQFRQMLGSDAKFKNLTNKEKQQFTETLAIMTGIPWMIYQNGIDNDDPKLVRQAQEMARENLKNLFETSPNNIVINDNGISFKK